MSSLYILEIEQLSEVSLANIFSYRIGSLFTSVQKLFNLFISLSVQKLFNLMSHLFILSFMSLALGDILVKILLHGISEIFLSMFFSKTFMVS